MHKQFKNNIFMETTNSTILKVMNVLFWIAFIGLCIETGAIITSFCVSIWINDAGAKNLYMNLNLSELFAYSKMEYIAIVSLLISTKALKAYIAYLAVKFFLRFKLSKPFGQELTAIFLQISYVSLGTGVLAILAKSYCKWIMKKGVPIPVNWSGDEILFFAGVIYVLALVFQKGTILQTENDLTV